MPNDEQHQRAQIAGDVQQAVLFRRAHRAVERPARAVDTEREAVDQRTPAGIVGIELGAIAPPRNGEQAGRCTASEASSSTQPETVVVMRCADDSRIPGGRGILAAAFTRRSATCWWDPTFDASRWSAACAFPSRAATAPTRASATRTCTPRYCRRWSSKYRLAGERLGDVTGGAVLKHSKDFNLVRECVLSSGLDPQTPGIDMQRACGTGPRRHDLRGHEDRARARWMRASPAVSTPSAIRPSSIRANTSSCCCAPIARRSAWGRIKPFFGLRPRHFKPVMPGVLEPRTGPFDGRTLRADGQDLEDFARRSGCARESQPCECRQGLGARVLQRSRGRANTRASRSTTTCAPTARWRNSRSSSPRSTAAAARARSPRAIPRRSPTARRPCC